MQQYIRTLCALCAISALCEHAAADSSFAAPVRLTAGLEAALTVMRIVAEVRAFLLHV